MGLANSAMVTALIGTVLLAACSNGSGTAAPAVSAAATPASVPATQTVDSKNLVVGLQDGYAGMSYNGELNPGEVDGSLCYTGTKDVQKNLNQTIYHLKSTYDQNSKSHTIEAHGYHISRATYLSNLVLEDYYKNLSGGMTLAQRKGYCGDKAIDKNFAGQRVDFVYTYQVPEGVDEPLEFDVVISNSDAELATIQSDYAPYYQQVLAAKITGEVQWGPFPCGGKDNSKTDWPKITGLDAVMFCMSLDETSTDLASEDDKMTALPMFHVTAAPNY